MELFRSVPRRTCIFGNMPTRTTHNAHNIYTPTPRHARERARTIHTYPHTHMRARVSGQERAHSRFVLEEAVITQSASFFHLATPRVSLS
jgi:hypothetical protein